MTSKIKNWLVAEYKNAGIEGLQIVAVMCAIKDALERIQSDSLFDKRFNVSKNISVLKYRSGTVEIHINIHGVLSTYESFDPMTKYTVYATRQETLTTTINASSHEEAWEIAKELDGSEFIELENSGQWNVCDVSQCLDNDTTGEYE